MKILSLKTSIFFLVLTFLLATSMQCKKSSDTVKEDVLPAETQTGKGTFGCLVNGEVWLPKGKSFVPGLSTIIQFNILSIGAMRGVESIGIVVRNFDAVGNYNLTMDDNGYTLSGKRYKCIEGNLIITKFDKINQIISGRFSLKIQNDVGEIINISQGRFDEKYTI